MEKERKHIGEKLALSIRSAADRLGVSVGHLRNENKRGKLRFVKSGRRTLITTAELHRYLGVQDCEINKQDAEIKSDEQ